MKKIWKRNTTCTTFVITWRFLHWWSDYHSYKFNLYQVLCCSSLTILLAFVKIFTCILGHFGPCVCICSCWMETDRVGSCACVVHMHSPVPQWERGQTGQRIDSSCGPSYWVLLNAAARPADSLHRTCCWTEAEAAFLRHTEETELGHSRFLFCICVCVLWSKPNQSQATDSLWQLLYNVNQILQSL